MNWDKSKEKHWSFQDCQVAARALGGAKRPMPRNNAAGANELTPGGGTRDDEQRGDSSRMARSAQVAD